MKFTFATSRNGNRSWSGADIEDDWSVEPWDHEVSSLADDVLLDTLESVEDDRSVTTINWKTKKSKKKRS